MRIDKAKLAYELARREWRQKRLSELSGVSRCSPTTTTRNTHTPKKNAKRRKTPQQRHSRGLQQNYSHSL